MLNDCHIPISARFLVPGSQKDSLSQLERKIASALELVGGEEKSGITFLECLQGASSIHVTFNITFHSQKN